MKRLVLAGLFLIASGCDREPTTATEVAAAPVMAAERAGPPPELPAGFAQQPLMWRQETHIGVAGSWYAEGNMEFAANNATQSTDVTARRIDGSVAGTGSTAAMSRHELWPVIDHFTTRSYLSIREDCGLTLEGRSQHGVWQSFTAYINSAPIGFRWGDFSTPTSAQQSFQACPVRNGGAIGYDENSCELLTYEISYDGGNTWEPYGAPFRKCLGAQA